MSDIQTDNLASNIAAPLAMDASSTLPARSGRGNILLVEDDEDVSEITSLFLRKLGWTVIAASSGASAVQQFENCAGDVDVLMTDMVMPGMSGRDLAETLYQKKSDLRIIFTSGYFPDVLPEHEAVGFLPKPFGCKDLADKLAEVLQRPAVQPPGRLPQT